MKKPNQSEVTDDWVNEKGKKVFSGLHHKTYHLVPPLSFVLQR